jgi:hypothetical protein
MKKAVFTSSEADPVKNREYPGAPINPDATPIRMRVREGMQNA